MMNELSFRAAGPADLLRIVELLTSAQLPLAAVEQHLDGFVLAIRNDSLAGCAALERYGATALLRSVAVAESQRNKGLGKQLVSRLINRARDEGTKDLLLLTTTAAPFFEAFGFRVISRTEAPAAVQSSVEFQGACPASATVMRLRLTQPETTEVEPISQQSSAMN